MQNAPFFVTKLGIKTLPCVIFFRSDSLWYSFIAPFYILCFSLLFCEKHISNIELHLVPQTRNFGISLVPSTSSSKISGFVLSQTGQNDAHLNRLLKENPSRKSVLNDTPSALAYARLFHFFFLDRLLNYFMFFLFKY